MRQFVCFLAVGVLSQTALANPVIDDFLDDVDPNPMSGASDVQVISVEQTAFVAAQPADIVSTRTVTASVGTVVTLGGGTLSTVVPAGGTLLLSYSGLSTPVSLVNGFLRTDFFGPTVTGAFDMMITLGDGVNSASITKSIGGGPVSWAQENHLDDEFTGVDLSAINGIDILFTGTDPVSFFGNSAANLQVIPEPSSYVLLGLTSLIGFVAFRRRQIAVEAA